MPRPVAERAVEPLIRKHIFFSPDDWEWLTATYGETIGPSRAIRLIIRQFRKNVEAKASAQAQRPALAPQPAVAAAEEPR